MYPENTIYLPFTQMFHQRLLGIWQFPIIFALEVALDPIVCMFYWRQFGYIFFNGLFSKSATSPLEPLSSPTLTPKKLTLETFRNPLPWSNFISMGQVGEVMNRIQRLEALFILLRSPYCQVLLVRKRHHGSFNTTLSKRFPLAAFLWTWPEKSRKGHQTLVAGST